MKATHEHEWEAAPGLPEPLPPGEKILWQGRPDWAALAVHAFHVRKLAIYFLIMLAWQMYSHQADGVDAVETFFDLMRFTTLSICALCLIGVVAWWSAATTLYTLTDKRLVMRVGIVLSLTFNLPLRCIRNADVRQLGRGRADIALQLPEGDRIGWFHLWPHQRAWELRHPQPTLRCVREGEAVARILQKAWTAQQSAAPSERASVSNPPQWQGVSA
ncbi:MAG: PH domain-containing protein [Limnohabitans sp.]|nr:PH domain-containing protein [Limnohabitans sp.]